VVRPADAPSLTWVRNALYSKGAGPRSGIQDAVDHSSSGKLQVLLTTILRHSLPTSLPSRRPPPTAYSRVSSLLPLCRLLQSLWPSDGHLSRRAVSGYSASRSVAAIAAIHAAATAATAAAATAAAASRVLRVSDCLGGMPLRWPPSRFVSVSAPLPRRYLSLTAGRRATDGAEATATAFAAARRRSHAVGPSCGRRARAGRAPARTAVCGERHVAAPTRHDSRHAQSADVLHPARRRRRPPPAAYLPSSPPRPLAGRPAGSPRQSCHAMRRAALRESAVCRVACAGYPRRASTGASRRRNLSEKIMRINL
jgi:hypothetical protein